MSSEAKLQEAHQKLINVSQAVEELSRTIAQGLRHVTLEDVEQQLKKLNRSRTSDRVLLFDMMEEQTLLTLVICTVMFCLCLFTCLYACNRKNQFQTPFKRLRFRPLVKVL
jgi:hypothetical protein